MVLAEIKTNIQNRGQHWHTAPSTFRLVPKKIYKPVLQYPCKLDPAEAAIISAVSQKYSIVRKGPSIISILTKFTGSKSLIIKSTGSTEPMEPS